jgi:hypothetical protein
MQCSWWLVPPVKSCMPTLAFQHMWLWVTCASSFTSLIHLAFSTCMADPRHSELILFYSKFVILTSFPLIFFSGTLHRNPSQFSVGTGFKLFKHSDRSFPQCFLPQGWLGFNWKSSRIALELGLLGCYGEHYDVFVRSQDWQLQILACLGPLDHL